ncbi:hypothetical protein [Chitinophaga nivalis]|uniref:Uncharacterized protein n=1 Tax=Chitinophaga nivalis TaxID=2991709 RepID=A0ABT3IJR7_9BACT|nr:hypothetical protein [Chitinophaga nivalis]MCW3466104.1 hypothetical protein [Chitinophaga nivalis]MCW3484205.1 hypothetical protein [Chitinophaga nivalis]
MQQPNRWLSLFLLLCACYAPAAMAQTTYLLEGEDFQFKGGWQLDKVAGTQVSGNNLLRVLGSRVKASDAMTVIKIKTAGDYDVWVRTPDFPANNPGTRLFRVVVNENPLPKESGQHGREGYYWEKAGTARLDTGENVIGLKDTRGNFGRCDAIVFTTTITNPNQLSLDSLRRFKIKPVAVAYTPPPPAFAATDSVHLPEQAPVLGTISNEHIRLQFVEGTTAAGVQGIFARTAVRKNNQWINVEDGVEGNRILLLQATDPQLSFSNFYPSWNGTVAFGSFVSRGKTFRILAPESLMNPFLAGKLIACSPMHVLQKNTQELEVTYVTTDSQTVKGIWQLNTDARHLSVTLTYISKQAGYYSLVLAAFNGRKPDQVSHILLPPMFQYQRIPDNPVLLPSAMMQQPLAIVETQQGQEALALFVSATTAGLPLEWGLATSSPAGFGIKNERNEVQPVVLAPIPGLDNAKLTAGQTLTRTFAAGVLPAGWNEALEYISDSIYQVKDYRQQTNTSLTETLFNITGLMNNDTAAGWDPALKGFYDIEADPAQALTVVQAAPLAVVAAAVLARDEASYISRALPTIEYTLSRSGFRWAKAVAGGSSGDIKTLVLSPFNSQFTTAYYAGLHQLLGEVNPWLKSVALPDNKIRSAKGYSVSIPAWTQELAAYRLTKDTAWLSAAKKDARDYIAKEVYGRKTVPVNKQSFYNTSFYAYWWELPDLYDITGDNYFMHAAEATAFHTLAGIRSFPVVKDTLQTIHPGNAYEGNTTIWWKGAVKYRLGFPRQPGDVQTKTVAQKVVSPVGLGFEQPVTYFDPGKLVRPVFMSSWAPHLLRLFTTDHRTIFETYARNAVIGRFTNYPGYYATGFTDITQQPDFPYKGPDVSSIYYHHIPPHLAFTLDFLVTETIQRSDGNVHFPYGKQDGFVWFNNRIFNDGKGNIYGDTTARLWLKRGLVAIDHPAVNYITAMSDSCFWLLLLNESTVSDTCHITLGQEVPVANNSSAAWYAAAFATPAPLAFSNRSGQVVLAPKGFAALAFPLTAAGKIQRPAVPPVSNGMQVLELGNGIGKCYAFRIRSPFGWDDIYVYLETPEGGRQLTVTANDTTKTVTTYPYECSFYPVNKDTTVHVRVIVQTGGGQTVEGTFVF